MSEESLVASGDDTRTLLQALEDALPIKRQVNIEGWPRPVWIWRLELPQLLDLNRKVALLSEGDKGKAEYGLELLVMCLGDEGAPGSFASARGRSWLRRQAEAVTKLIPLALDFNEVTGPSADRKKKSVAATSEDSSPLPSELA